MGVCCLLNAAPRLYTGKWRLVGGCRPSATLACLLLICTRVHFSTFDPKVRHFLAQETRYSPATVWQKKIRVDSVRVSCIEQCEREVISNYLGTISVLAPPEPPPRSSAEVRPRSDSQAEIGPR